MSTSSGPYKLVTVNTAPDRAKRLIGRVVEDVKDKYTIIHVGNAACKCSLPWFLLIIASFTFPIVDWLAQPKQQSKK